VSPEVLISIKQFWNEVTAKVKFPGLISDFMKE
jgi:hypothetical protein